MKKFLVIFLVVGLILSIAVPVYADTIYVVQSGDTLYGIARKFNVSVEAIIAANKLTNPNALQVGQSLVIPDGTSASSASATTPTAVSTGATTSASNVYIVQAGDTLEKIATKFGLSASEIANANGITNMNAIRVGQSLVIPAKVAGSTTPQRLDTLDGKNGTIIGIAFSPDGKMLASAHDSGKVILWNVASRRRLAVLSGHTNEVFGVAFSPDGKLLASGSADGTLIIWDVTARRSIGKPLTGHTDQVESVAFSPDGKMIASSSNDGSIILWDVITHQPIGSPFIGHTSLISPGTMYGDTVLNVAFSPDGKMLASGGQDQTVRLWDVTTHQQIGEPLNGHSSWVTSVAFSPDGRTLASGSSDGTAQFWDVVTRQSIGTAVAGEFTAIWDVEFNSNGSLLASGDTSGQTILWDVASHQPVTSPLTTNDYVTCVAFSPSGKLLASCNAFAGTITLWDVSSVSLAATQANGPQKFPIDVTVYCGFLGPNPLSAQVDQPVVLNWSWRAATAAYRQDYIEAASFSLQIDGQPIDTSSAVLTLSNDGNSYFAEWKLPARTFSVGTHEIVPGVTFSRQITDGFRNSAGNLFTYGPGPETFPPCYINVN